MNTQQWISEFLFTRALFKGPINTPLYAYQVNEDEYLSLISLLKKAYFNVHPAFTKPHPTAACFCLFVSEYYRRYYNGSWSWSGPEDILGVKIAQEDRSTLVRRGLEYWGREVKTNENGSNYLGSLFAEGGLPWPLVGKDQHGFGKAIKRGIKNFYQSDELKRSLTDLMEDYQNELPQSFQNHETIQLLAAIVHQLMAYAQQIPSDFSREPAAYLDHNLPNWNKAFPIPLDITNGRLLVNEWLAAAVETDVDKKLYQEKLKAFSSEHTVIAFSPETAFESTLYLPKELTIEVDPLKLSTMRFETAIYEGERLAAKSLAVYGQKNDKNVKVRFSVTQIQLLRNEPTSTLVFKLLENGRAFYSHEISASAIDLHDSPLVLVEQDSQWKMISSASCTLKAQVVRTIIPLGAEIHSTDEAHPPRLVTENSQGSCYELTATHKVKTATDSFIIKLNSHQDISPFRLQGMHYYGEAVPQTVYLGMPTLCIDTKEQDEPVHYQEFINGISRNKAVITAGTINYQVKDPAGYTLYRRQFALLPRDFHIVTKAARLDETAKLFLETQSPIVVSTEHSDYYHYKRTSEQKPHFEITVKNDQQLPSLLFKVSCIDNTKPVLLRLPYPAMGVKLLSPDNAVYRGTELLLNQLAGYRLVLNSANHVAEVFKFQFTVVSKDKKLVSITKSIKVTSHTETIGLYGFYHELIQLLSVTDDQDALVQLNISTNRSWLTLNIRRYNTKLMRESDTSLAVIYTHVKKQLISSAELFAMSLTDPNKEPIQLEKLYSEGVETGLYSTVALKRVEDLYLIYSRDNPQQNFRPMLYVTLNSSEPSANTAIKTLHAAAKAFHPVSNPTVFADVIEQMSLDFNHSGWQYLTAIKQKFSHLPLSTFEAWRALAQNPRALALAMFRLELDEALCLRFRDELAVVFEAIPLQIWVDVRKYFKGMLVSAGLPEPFVNNTIRNRDG
ncbi:MAG: STY4851/ECs_5259 family protein, partial [Paraglaciecola sp.]|nr:STY4851/ECs_5259 family protein [Paraglaciecola sp.]